MGYYSRGNGTAVLAFALRGSESETVSLLTKSPRTNCVIINISWIWDDGFYRRKKQCKYSATALVFAIIRKRRNVIGSKSEE